MSKRASLLLAYFALCLISLVFLFPFYWALISSLKSNAGLDLTPPTFYPAEERKLDFSVSSAGRVVTAQNSHWLRLVSSPDLLAENEVQGGYYQKLQNDGAPSQEISWFPDSSVSIVNTNATAIRFKDIPVEKFPAGALAIAGVYVRPKGGSFDELTFVVPDRTKQVVGFTVYKNESHTPIRDFSPHFDNYVNALKGPEASFGEQSTGFILFMRNSFFIAILSVIGEVLAGSLVAFGFSRLKFKGRQPLFVVLLATMMIPAQVTMIPMFAIYKSLHWIDTFLPLIVPHFLGGAFNIFLIRQYMLTIPKELDEAAKIDGCGPLRTYWQVILPNCTAPLILVGLFTFMGCWGDVMGPLIYLDNPAYRTVPLGLAFFQSPYVDNRSIIMAGAVLAMLPVAILFLIFQRYILSGTATSGLGGR